VRRAYAIVTDQTCGEACWHAREDVCRCACGGKNHGILRSQNGQQPVRTRRIASHMYQMLAVESANASCRAASMHPMEDQQRSIVGRLVDAGRWDWRDFESTPGYPVILRTASVSEVERWPELASWRSTLPHGKPLVSWIRVDLAQGG